MLLPYLPTTLEVLLLSPPQPEVADLMEVLQLTNQLVLRRVCLHGVCCSLLLLL
jgi:hypothetical protein